MSIRDFINAVEDMIATDPPEALPWTTVTEDTGSGPGVLTVHIEPVKDTFGRNRIRTGCRVRFLDGLGEKHWTVKDIDTATASVLTLAASPVIGRTGLVHDHLAGTRLTSNLIGYSTMAPAPMMELGDVLLSVGVQQQIFYLDTAPHGFFPRTAVHVQSDIRLARPTKDGLDAETWAEHCHDLTVQIIDEELRQLFLDNENLITEYEPGGLAIEMGDMGNGRKMITTLTEWPQPVKEGAEQIWHYIGSLDAAYVANGGG